ncbi:rod-binding protein [Vallitalea sp.]|jgi:flagellar protein FlgJ|uniref:rod-binding protein n=1 Tax=Vallitalea sp. TaxID=1882829 RepID=UPI0025F0F85B|nr:rod-binding protein [Vallitalea sp.]MCT4687994.1 rod-binding protein [Vallitalea sp.]
MDISSINGNTYNNMLLQKKEKIESKSFEATLNEAVKKEDDKQLKEACKEFEQYFVNQLFKEMRNTVHNGGLIPKSQGEELFEDMLYDEYSKEISEGSGIGISDMMYKQLSKSLK